MTILRIASLSATTQSRLRIAKLSASGTSPASPPRLRIAKLSASGVQMPVVAVAAPQAIGPGQQVTLTASMLYGGTADSWTWRRVSGPAVTLNGAGASRTLVGPSVMPAVGGGSPPPLVLGVRATSGSQTSAEVLVTIAVRPQLSWSWNGTAWVGARVVTV